MNFPNEADTSFARERLSSGCDTMKQLLLGLLDTKGKVAEEVHAIRKLGKSLRGGFWLFRLEKSSALEIQAIGRLLSEPRDAVSRMNTWNKLAWNADPKVSMAIAGLLDQQTHSAARRPPPETIAWCVERTDAAQKELDGLAAEELAGVIAKGLEKLEKRTLKRCHKLAHREPEDFHEARKAVKALLGAVGFLPEGVMPLDPKLHDMAEMLGDENDLATLSWWLGRHGFTSRFAPDLWKSLERVRRGLQNKAIKVAAKLSSSQAG